MDIINELEFIEENPWNNPLLGASAKNLLIALKALSEYADAKKIEISEITPQEILKMFVESDPTNIFKIS